MSAAELALRVREDAGKRAMGEALMLDRLVETMRLASFRSYLLATVDTMSALVPDVLEMAGSDVPSALQRLRPGHMWPMVARSESDREPTGPATSRRAKSAGEGVKRRTPFIADAVIADGALGDFVTVRIVGTSLEVTLRSGGYELSTLDGTGHVRLAGRLPDTVVAVCPGRPLASVVDHPLLRSRGYVIDRAAQIGGVSSLAFDVGRLPLVLPWRN